MSRVMKQRGSSTAGTPALHEWRSGTGRGSKPLQCSGVAGVRAAGVRACRPGPAAGCGEGGGRRGGAIDTALHPPACCLPRGLRLILQLDPSAWQLGPSAWETLVGRFGARGRGWCHGLPFSAAPCAPRGFGRHGGSCERERFGTGGVAQPKRSRFPPTGRAARLPHPLPHRLLRRCSCRLWMRPRHHSPLPRAPCASSRAAVTLQAWALASTQGHAGTGGADLLRSAEDPATSGLLPSL